MLPLVIVAALMGGGVLWAFTRSQAKAVPSSVSQGTPDAIKPPAPTTAPGVAVTPVVGPPVVDTVAELAAQIALADAQRKLEQQKQLEADAARQRAYDIRGFQDRIAAIENLMKLDLVQLTSIERDDSRLNDYLAQALRARGAEGTATDLYNRYLSSPAWGEAVAACKKQVAQNCGYDFFGICNSANQPKCESRDPSDPNWPAYQFWQRAQRDFALHTKEANEAAQGQLRMWKRSESLPAEARLSERERQYRGMVAELQRVYGVAYVPMDAEAQAAHARAKV